MEGAAVRGVGGEVDEAETDGVEPLEGGGEGPAMDVAVRVEYRRAVILADDESVRQISCADRDRESHRIARVFAVPSQKPTAPPGGPSTLTNCTARREPSNAQTKDLSRAEVRGG